MKMFSLKHIEKLVYLVTIPSIMAFGAFAIYKKNFLEFDKRGQHIKKIEDKYIPTHNSNMIKLLNYKQKVFVIGLIDDILDRREEKDKEKVEKFQH